VQVVQVVWLYYCFEIFSTSDSAQYPLVNFNVCTMSAEPKEGSANAFARLMRPQTSSDSITLPAIISLIDGSPEDSTATDTCPDYSSAYIVKANSSSCPSKLGPDNHLRKDVEELQALGFRWLSMKRAIGVDEAGDRPSDSIGGPWPSRAFHAHWRTCVHASCALHLYAPAL
jgi:hypothetical protein